MSTPHCTPNFKPSPKNHVFHQTLSHVQRGAVLRVFLACIMQDWSSQKRAALILQGGTEDKRPAQGLSR